MKNRIFSALATAAVVITWTSPAAASQTPRDLLSAAAFQAPDKARALALVNQAIVATDKALAANPGNAELTLQRGIAIGYRAKLTRSRSDAKAALGIFDKLAAQNPKDPEPQLAVAGWHLDAIDNLGSFVARTMLGAKAQVGNAALLRAVALGGNRSLYSGYAALIDIRSNPQDVATARKWAETAATGQTPTALDSVMKRAAIAILPSLRANNGKAAAAQARKLLPFGKLD